MSDKEVNFRVSEARIAYYNSDVFSDYSDAEAYARKKAYVDGEDFVIFSRLAIAKAPEKINDVKVEKVS